MPYLTLTRISGEPDRLLEGYHSSADAMSEVGRDHGLILHAAASTDDGLLIVNLWPSRDGSESAARDPRRRGEMNRNALGPEQIRPEHHELANLVLFER